MNALALPIRFLKGRRERKEGAREEERAQRGGSGETFGRCCGLESPRSGTEGKPLTPALSPSDGAREERRSAEQGCAAKPTGSALLRFEGLQKRYGAVAALGGIELSVAGGSVLALLGPNGAGKSTLFGCLLGLVHPTAGRVHFQGQPIKESDRARFGYLAERIALYPQRTVRENGLFFARLKQQPPSELEQQLKRVGLQGVQDRPVRQLSKGMLQRLGLAIALCGQPELLVLDEPFNGLDPALLDGLQRILREEQARGATLLISTHTMSAIEPLATHVAILLQGRLALSGTLDALRAGHGEEESLEMIYHRIARQSRGANPEEVL